MMKEWLQRGWFLVRQTLMKRRRQRELDEELRFHLEQSTAAMIAAGMTAAEARRQALIEFGGVERTREQCHEARPGWWLGTVAQDVRYALRGFRRNLAFTAIAATSLALAIGANTTIFSLANSLLYDRLNVAHADQLRMLRWHGDSNAVVQSMWGDFDASGETGVTASVFSYPVYQQLRDHSQAMQDLLAYKEDSMNATVRGNAQRAVVAMVSGNYFAVLGAQPQLGRSIQPSDDHAGAMSAVAVISDGFWEREFGRSASALGQTINVNQSLFTVIGVTPRGFTGAKNVQSSPDVFVPLSMQPLVDPKGSNASLLDDPDMWWVNITGRTRTGFSDEQAQAELNVALAAAVRGTMTVKAGDTMPQLEVVDGSRGLQFAAQMFEKPVYVLMTLTGFVLLLACANIANLLLARGAQRQREMIGAAGAGRWAWTGSAPVADGESSAGWDWRGRRTVFGLPWPQCDSEIDGECVGPGPVECSHELERLRVRYCRNVTDRAGLRTGSGVAGGAQRGRRQLEGERADRNTAAQGAGRQGDCGLSGCAVHTAGVGRRAFSADTFRPRLDPCGISHRSSCAFRGRASQAALWARQGRAVASAAGAGICGIAGRAGRDAKFDGIHRE